MEGLIAIKMLLAVKQASNLRWQHK